MVVAVATMNNNSTTPNQSMMTESTRLALIIGGVILGGLLLMTATGLTVYFGFCVNRSVPPGQASSQLIRCNCPIRPQCPVFSPCPEEEAEPCPPHPLMPTTFDPNTCLVPCQPECSQENCFATTPTNCRQYTTTTQVPVFELTEEDMMSKTVLEWVMQYPPNSYGRLQVLTQLMEFGVENHVQKMTRRNCQRPYKVCLMCLDRYQFLRCAMKMIIKGNKLAYKNTNKLTLMNPNFAEIYAYVALVQSEYDKLIIRNTSSDSVIAAFQAFWFTSDDGSECTWCKADEDVYKHINCIWKAINTLVIVSLGRLQ